MPSAHMLLVLCPAQSHYIYGHHFPLLASPNFVAYAAETWEWEKDWDLCSLKPKINEEYNVNLP